MTGMKIDDGENPKNESLQAAYVHVAVYFIVFIIVLATCLFIKEVFLALGMMGIAVVLIIVAISYYTSTLFKRSFGKQFREMFFLTVGVAVVAFLIGSVLRRFINGGI